MPDWLFLRDFVGHTQVPTSTPFLNNLLAQLSTHAACDLSLRRNPEYFLCKREGRVYRIAGYLYQHTRGEISNRSQKQQTYHRGITIALGGMCRFTTARHPQRAVFKISRIKERSL